MTKTELKQNITKIKKLLKQRNYDAIDIGIELARALNEPAVFETLLGGVSYDKSHTCPCSEKSHDELHMPREEENPIYGRLSIDWNYTGDTLIKKWSYKTRSYFTYILWNLVAYSPENENIDKTLTKSKITKINLCGRETIDEYDKMTRKEFSDHTTQMERLPKGISEFNNLEELDISNNDFIFNLLPKNLKVFRTDYWAQTLSFINLTNLTSLDLSLCRSLQNVDGLANLTNLTSLNLGFCKSLQNVDGLANCTNLTSLNLHGCDSLQNVDGLAILPKLTSLDLRWSEKIQPKPSEEEMTTREEVAAYQEEIKKSMK